MGDGWKRAIKAAQDSRVAPPDGLVPRRKIRGNIALVVHGGHAQAKDGVVLSAHRTRQAAERAAYKAREAHPFTGYDAHVEWADEFVDAGGVYP